jgi:hypothetical protein
VIVIRDSTGSDHRTKRTLLVEACTKQQQPFATAQTTQTAEKKLASIFSSETTGLPLITLPPHTSVLCITASSMPLAALGLPQPCTLQLLPLPPLTQRLKPCRAIVNAVPPLPITFPLPPPLLLSNVLHKGWKEV